MGVGAGEYVGVKSTWVPSRTLVEGARSQFRITYRLLRLIFWYEDFAIVLGAVEVEAWVWGRVGGGGADSLKGSVAEGSSPAAVVVLCEGTNIPTKSLRSRLIQEIQSRDPVTALLHITDDAF